VAELNSVALVAVQNTGESNIGDVDVTAVPVEHLIDNNVSRGLPLA